MSGQTVYDRAISTAGTTPVGPVRLLAPVKWFWVATGFEFGVNIIGCDAGDYYTAGVITATSDVEIPAPIDVKTAMVDNGSGSVAVWEATIGEPPLGHVDVIGDGVQIGDRVMFSDAANIGHSGVFVVTALGETGVSPWSMERSTDLPHADRYQPWIVYMDGWGDEWAAAPNARLLAGYNDVTNFFYPASVATGYGAVASAPGATAHGPSSVASGPFSVASGSQSVASGYLSVASGSRSTASGWASVASGQDSSALGSVSTASGSRTVAVAVFSTAATANSTNVVYATTT